MAPHRCMDSLRGYFSSEWKTYQNTTLRQSPPFDSGELFMEGLSAQPIPPNNGVYFPMSSPQQPQEIITGRGGRPYYARAGSPLEDELVRRLVQAEAGYAPQSPEHISAAVFPSGMAAITGLLLLYAHAFPPDSKKELHFVVGEEVYAETTFLFEHLVPRLGFGRTIFTDTSNPESVSQVLSYHPGKIVSIFYETLSSPFLRYSDTRKIREIADWHGGVPLVVDTTLLPPLLQQQFRLGADVIVYSLSKYVSGAGDIMGGALIGPQQLLQDLRQLQRITGNILALDSMSTFCQRLESLPQRIEQHLRNTAVFVKYLQQQAGIERVYYPALSNLTAAASAGAVFSFSFRGEKPLEKAKKVECFLEFLIQHPASPISYQVGFGSQKHAIMPHLPSSMGKTPPGLLRFAVGRTPSAEEVLPFLEEALGYAITKGLDKSKD